MALAALIKLVERGEIKKPDRVVVISTANGLKFPEFKVRYHLGKLTEVTPRYTNVPVEAPADLGKVLEVIERRQFGDENACN